jgi:hypothetical protein
MKKISIDFDDTLSERYVTALMDKFEVHIVTSRLSNERAPSNSWNDDLFLVADNLAIPRDNIHFCNLHPKYEFFIDCTFGRRCRRSA